MYKINTKIFYQEDKNKTFVILGTKTDPFTVEISSNTSYFIYPPYGFDYIIGIEELTQYQISDLVYAKEYDIELVKASDII